MMRPPRSRKSAAARRRCRSRFPAHSRSAACPRRAPAPRGGRSPVPNSHDRCGESHAPGSRQARPDRSRQSGGTGPVAVWAAGADMGGPSNLACAKRLYGLFPISGVLKPAPLAWRDFPKDSAMGLQAMIFEQFEQVARDQDKPLAKLAPGMVLLESGLDSLCFAIIVARLEDRVGRGSLHRFRGCVFSR